MMTIISFIFMNFTLNICFVLYVHLSRNGHVGPFTQAAVVLNITDLAYIYKGT